ncbi:MAG: hypothetical protein AAFW68_08280 [Pseudomonadota bacterium]
MVAIRTMVVGAGAAGAAMVAAVTQPFGVGEDKDLSTSDPSDEVVVCLKSDLVFFEGVDAQCFSRDALRALANAPVADLSGQPVAMTMTHPTDMTVESAESVTCRDYRKMQFDGWFAMTARDMRREAYFLRACGVLAALADARPAERSYFIDGSPSVEGVATLAEVIRFGELNPAEDLTVEKQEGYQWRIGADSLTVVLQELANADFDNDGVEEILAFTFGAPEGGTAVFYDVGLIERDAAGGDLKFTPLSFGRDEAAGAAG